MEFNAYDSLKKALENQVRRLKQKTDRLQMWGSRISNARFIVFLLGAGFVYWSARSSLVWLFALVLAIVVAIFAGLVYQHRRIDKIIKRFSGLERIRRRHLARMLLNWDGIPESSAQINDEPHPFARDFGLTGTHSLLRLMDTTTYTGSVNYLKKWLLEREPDLSAIRKRQALVKELKPMAYFRDRLRLNATLTKQETSDDDWDMDELLDWLRSAPQKKFTLALIILGGLSAINITLLILLLIGILPPYVVISFVVYLLTYNFYSGKISGLFDEAMQIENLLSRFRSILLYLESFPYKPNSSLRDFCSIYHHAGQRPGPYLKKIIRLASAASSQGSELIWLLLNSLVPWDIFLAWRLDAYKQELEPKLRRWLDRFYRLEALCSIANFAWLNPEYSFALPRNSQDVPVFKAEALGHPLIPRDRKVTNNVTIEDIGDIQLITGSNMAGKSTFLRTLGINLCLCFVGGPVNAVSFNTTLFRLFSSINVTDSLNEGLSHFYAEVKRLRQLMDALNTDHATPLFFFVDEIYRGTNNRERLKGSAAFLKNVAGRNGVGLVSTHDLELAQLEDEISPLSNWHFEETIINGKMEFEYKLKAGPSPSTNALKIMEIEGLPV